MTTEAASVDLLYSEEEEQLRSAVRGLLADRSPVPAIIAGFEDAAGYDKDLWSALVGLGVVGLHLPEAHGGGGASHRETAVVMEELGRALAPTPFLGTAVLALEVLARCAPERISALLSGGLTATVVLPLSTSPWAPAPFGVTVREGLLEGVVRSVVDVPDSGLLVVPAWDGPELSLFAVERVSASVAAVTSFDQTRPVFDVTLTDAPGEVLSTGDAAERTLLEALLAAAALLASEQVGVAERCLELTLAYAKERQQFGRPIGSFQAIKHRLADLFVGVSQARAVARYAAACLGPDGVEDREVAVCLAQAFCSDLTVRAAEECVQIHGGMGFTWEHPAHVLLKRAKADQVALGTADQHREALAYLVDLPAPT